ncbi:MAG TPA: hypothetical protein VGL94_03200 [Ktedonobacteraceae bacterium]
MRGKTTAMQSIPSTLVKWIYLLLILLAITINTSVGQLPITRAIPSRPTGCLANNSCSVAAESMNHRPDGLRSNGCPITPSPINPVVSVIISSVCFYNLSGNTSCNTNYQLIGTICYGFKNNTPPISAGDGQCPPAQSGAGTVYVLNAQCFFLAATSDACGSSYTFNVPVCSASVKATSNFTVSGCPTLSSLTPISKPQYQICFYQLAPGAQCAANYNKGAQGIYCVAFTSGSSPTNGSAQCPPTPSGAGTVYITSDGYYCYFIAGDLSQCTGQYNGQDVPVCTARPTITLGAFVDGIDLDAPPPKAGCPTNAVNGVTYTLQSDGTCKGSDGSTISATCPQGYVDSGSGCSFNTSLDLTDVSSDPCTLTNTGEEEGEGGGEEEGNLTYTCPYTNTTLVCYINTSNLMEYCYMGNGSISYYECSINTNNDPISCWYYGPNDATKSTLFATSTCTPPSSSSSSLSDCNIVACFNSTTTSSSKTMFGGGCSADANAQANPAIIEVKIEQQCTSQQDGVILSCTYVYTHHRTIKSRYFQITCKPDTPINCNPILGPYSTSIARSCAPPDDSFTSVCNTTDSRNNAPVWRGSCSPNQNSPNQNCRLFANNTDTNDLGSVSCDVNGTCNIVDDNGNTMTLNNCGTSPTFNCKSTTPACPTTTPEGNLTPPLSESNLTCRGELVMDSLISPTITSLTIIYPLSAGELQWVLAQLGIGSQSWLSQAGMKNLPTIVGL